MVNRIVFSLLTSNMVLFAGCQHVPLVSQQHAATSKVCHSTNESEIAGLFDRWNQSLQTLDPQKVAANYAPQSVLLATLAAKPKLTADEKIEYFQHFLENQPVGTITYRQIFIDCNSAVDTGLYTFNFKKTGKVAQARYTYTYQWDGKQWLISSHHSSLLPTMDLP